MRADRVLGLLLLLQARGRLTAGELAARLEVSRRTVYRDVDALSSAGVPVRADPGPNGGIELMAGWRTDLTGLTAPEVEALFTSAAGPAFESAMGKLAAALPGEGGRRAGRIRERLLVDSAGWGGRTPQASPHLRMVQDAVFGDRRLRLRYRLADVDGERRLFRLSRIEAAEALDEPARRPKRFDLAKAWRRQSAEWESGRSGYEVVVKAATDDDLALLLRVSGDRVVGRPRRRAVRLAFPALEPAAAFVSSFGAKVEVIEPAEARTALAQRGAELVMLYESEGTKKAGRPSDRP